MICTLITWRDRAELRRAIPSLLEATSALGGEVMVVNYGGRPDLLASQLEGYSKYVTVIQVDRQKYFHKALAQNIGVYHTQSPLLFFCDSDIILETRTLRELTDRLLAESNTFATLAGVRETEANARGGNNVVCFGYELHIRIANGRELRIVDHEEDAADGTRNAPGLLLVRREDFLRIGGYNSNLHGWGWEDQDMIGRLTLGAGLKRILHGNAIHISHKDSLRVANYPVSNRWESRDKMFRQALYNYDRSDFLGTYTTDIARIPSRRIKADAAASAYS